MVELQRTIERGVETKLKFYSTWRSTTISSSRWSPLIRFLASRNPVIVGRPVQTAGQRRFNRWLHSHPKDLISESSLGFSTNFLQIQTSFDYRKPCRRFAVLTFGCRSEYRFPGFCRSPKKGTLGPKRVNICPRAESEFSLVRRAKQSYVRVLSADNRIYCVEISLGPAFSQYYPWKWRLFTVEERKKRVTVWWHVILKTLSSETRFHDIL